MNARTNSLIGQASSDDIRIALHYENAAKILYESDACPDHIVLPFLFLVRQFLELGLKYNIKKLKDFSNCDDLVNELNRAHDLQDIHSAFLVHFNGAKSELNICETESQENLNSLSTLVEKIVSLDNNSQGFRYAENKKGQKFIDAGISFNLQEVFDLLENSSNILVHTENVLCLNQSS